MNFNKIEMNGYTLYHIPDKKFKTFTVGGYFFRPLKKIGMIESTILANLMMKSNQMYPTEQLLTRHLEQLYGTNLYVGFNKIALVNSMSFVIKSINGKYLTNCEMDLLKESVNLLNQTINYPCFEQDKFNLEKELLIDDINQVYDDKFSYANLKCIEAAYPNEMCRHSIASLKDEAIKVSFEDIKKEYQSLLQAKKIFYVIGDFEFEEIKKLFSDIVFCESAPLQLEFLDYQTKEITKVNEVIETDYNNQSIVIMVYRSEIRENDDLFYGMYLFNNMIGGFFHSTLFQEIREKRSLAYSISSEYNSKKGTFAIVAGINKDKYQEFKQIVKHVIEDYQNGFFTEELMNITKKMLINSQYKFEDQPSSGMSIIRNDAIGLKNHTVEEKVAIIKAIKKDDVIFAANQLKLDTIFFLEGIK